MPITQRKIAIAAVFLLLLPFVFYAGTNGETAELDEFRVKAAYIFNFAKFIDWPPQTFADGKTPLVLYILGDDPFGDRLNEIENKMIGDRKFVIRRIHSMDEGQACQMLFIAGSEKDRLDRILLLTKGAGILTISDIPNFTRIGGMIGFTTAGDNIRFEVNLSAARASKLEISSKLMKLADTVREGQ